MQLSNIKAQIEKRVEEELEKQLRDIPNTVQKVVEDAVLSIIGVRRSGKHYEVDNWSKREEALNGYIKRKVEEALEEFVGPVVDKELRRLLKLISLKKSIAQRLANEAQYSFDSGFKRKIGDRFEELGETVGERIGDQLDTMLADVATFNDDICDPESFQGKIGELFLEEIAKTVG